MSDTKAVEETRCWRRQAFEETKNLSPADLRAREEKLIRQVRATGVEFNAIYEQPPATPAGQAAFPRRKP